MRPSVILLSLIVLFPVAALAQEANKRQQTKAQFGQVSIDGSVDEAWERAETTRVDRPVKAFSKIDTTNTATAELKFLWDDKHLFILAEIDDSQLNGNHPAPWEQDSVEFFVDETMQRSKNYEADDGQYRVSFKGLVSYGQSTNGKMRAAAKRTEEGYRVEAAIAWQKIKPHDGKKIGFEAQVNDDAGAGRRQAVVKWNEASDNSWRDTSGFGTLILVGGDRQSKDAVETVADSLVVAKDVISNRVPAWSRDAIFYQIFPERFRNGDPANDPTHDSLEFPDITPKNWAITPWTSEWYERADWEKQMGSSFYEDGVFHRRLGGDLQGVIDKLDYLADLGINTIYFNPVFYARSLHKYDGNSFHHVDPYFGPDPKGDLELMASETADPKSWHWTQADQLFLSLVRKAHERGIRVIVDGVFNHTGRDFWAFADIANKQQESAYLDWYTIQKFDDPATPENEFKYACWWGVDTLPEFADNADGTDLHPKPKAYIFQSTARWMDPNNDGNPDDGIDGWRLDVANEVPNQFWRDWNAEVRRINPEAFTVAEFWDDAGNYLADCGFSSTMNYYGFAYPAKGFLVDGRMSATQFANWLTERLKNHPPEAQFALQNLMDSHDVDRLASQIVNADHQRPYLNEDKFDYDIGDRVSPRHFPEYDVSRPSEKHKSLLRLTTLFQMSFIGAPMIYYGTEAGMDGADDPDDRMPMVWDDLQYAPRTLGPYGKLDVTQAIEFDQELFEYFQRIIRMRHENEALRSGKFDVIATDDESRTIVFGRQSDQQQLIVAINRGSQPSKIRLPDDFDASKMTLQPVFCSGTEEAISTKQDKSIHLQIPALTGQIWKVVLKP